MQIFIRPSLALVLIALVAFTQGTAQEKDKKKPAPKKQANVYTDIADAPVDYKLQGEYAGDRLAAQVVARGNNKLDVYLLQGGLPGAGWDIKSKKIKIEAKIDSEKGVAELQGGQKGRIDVASQSLSLIAPDGKTIILKRVDRVSPTLGAKPPQGALILFDGKNAAEWKDGKMSGEYLAVPNTSRRTFKDFNLHIEFRTPFQPTAGGQGRGNSGVYLLGREIQVLDSFGLKGENNECGGLYGQRAPDVNMCLPPLVWQTYDVEFRTGPLDPKTKKQGSPRITVRHNGVLVHENVELKGGANQGVINLQNHGNPVVYRNIWIVEIKQ